MKRESELREKIYSLKWYQFLLKSAYENEIESIRKDWMSRMKVQNRTLGINITRYVRDQRAKLLEPLMEIKYQGHNPKKDCDCGVCEIINKIRKKL